MVHRKVIFRMLLPITVICILCLSTVIFVHAYEINEDTSKFDTDQYKLTCTYAKNGSIDWTSKIKSGVNAWNKSDAKVYVYLNKKIKYSEANYTITSASYGSTGWHGLHWSTSDDNRRIKLNDSYSS
jgi:hypothetical protein